MKQTIGLLCVAAALLAGCDAKPRPKRMILLTNSIAPFWDSMRAGMQDAAKELNLDQAGLVVEMDRNDGSAKGQLDKLNQYAGQGDIAAVALSLTDSTSVPVADAMRRLRQRGVKVITVDCDVDLETARDARFAYLGTDNVIGGRELGRAAQGLRPEGGKYAAFVGVKSAGNAMDRMRGFAEGAGESFEQVDYLSDDVDLARAQNNVRNALVNHPEIDTLVGIWAYNADAIGQVIKERGLSDKVAAVVFDADPRAIDHMADGLIDVMVVQDPYEMGFKATQLMHALATNNQQAIEELYPAWNSAKQEFTRPAGDQLITGLKVVVPDENSPLTAEMFEESTQFLTLSEFRAWLDKYGLKGS